MRGLDKAIQENAVGRHAVKPLHEGGLLFKRFFKPHAEGAQFLKSLLPSPVVRRQGARAGRRGGFSFSLAHPAQCVPEGFPVKNIAIRTVT